MADKPPFENNIEPEQFINRLVAYIHAYSNHQELKALNWYAHKLGGNSIDDICYSFLEDNKSVDESIEEKNSELDELITQEIYQSKTFYIINEKQTELTKDEIQEMSQIELLFIKKVLAFIRFDKKSDTDFKIGLTQQYLLVIDRIKANSILHDKGNEILEFLRKESTDLINHLKKQIYLNPYYCSDRITLYQLEDLFLELERKEFVRNLSEFRNLLSGKYTFNHEARMVWEKKGTALIYLYYCIYGGRYFKGEAINEIIPKFFSHVDGSPVNTESLRVGLSTLIGKIGTDFLSPRLSSHQNTIKLILEQKGVL